MHLTISKSVLLKELNFIQGVVEKKNTIQILSNLLLEARNGALGIKGTDLDVSISTICDAEVKKEGSVCIQAKKLFEIVRALPEAAIEIKSGEQDQVSIVCERSRFKMLGLPKDNFPEIQEFKGQYISLPADLFKTFISRTIFAITNEESRYSLNGAKFELSGGRFRMVATDGHRLSFIEKNEKNGQPTDDLKVDVIIPKKTLSELLKLSLEIKERRRSDPASPDDISELAKQSSENEELVEFGQDENHLFFKVGKRLLVSRLLSGQFPNYELVLPKENKNHITIDRELVAGAIRRVALMADERSHAIKFDVANGQINITSQATDVGEARETLPVDDYTGDAIAAGFNAQYLHDFFGVVQDEKVVFKFKDGTSQAEIGPQSNGEYEFRYIIMPMRL